MLTELSLKHQEILAADKRNVKALNKLLAGSGYQVKRSTTVRVYNEDGKFLFRSRSLVAAVVRIWDRIENDEIGDLPNL